MNNQKTIQINNDMAVKKTFYDLIRAQACYRLPNLIRDRVYGTESLLGEEFIDMFDDVEGLLAEMCLGQMARRNSLPLISLRRGHQGPKIFILK